MDKRSQLWKIDPLWYGNPLLKQSTNQSWMPTSSVAVAEPFASLVLLTLSRFTLPFDEWPKQEMLHDWHFFENLCLVHFQHPTVHFAPGWHCTDIIKHWWVFSQCTLLHSFHKLHTAQIHKLMGEILQYIRVVNGLGLHISVVHKLCWAKNEGEEVVVIQTPHTMWSCRRQTPSVSHLNAWKQWIKHCLTVGTMKVNSILLLHIVTTYATYNLFIVLHCNSFWLRSCTESNPTQGPLISCEYFFTDYNQLDHHLVITFAS